VNPYRHTLSLRIRHPQMRDDQITASLGLSPKHAWTAGEPRKSPKGTLLEGLRTESYWSSLLGNTATSEVGLLEESIESALRSLEPHAQFLAEIIQSGGRAELFIGLFGDRNLGFELSPSMLKICSELGLALAFEIYPDADTSREAVS
jgi:hypothetical protein